MGTFFQVLIPALIWFAIGVLIAYLIWGTRSRDA